MAGAAIVLVASGFSGLSRRYARAGNGYGLVGETLGRRPGSVSGWVLLASHIVFTPVAFAGSAFCRAGLTKSPIRVGYRQPTLIISIS